MSLRSIFCAEGSGGGLYVCPMFAGKLLMGIRVSNLRANPHGNVLVVNRDHVVW